MNLKQLFSEGSNNLKREKATIGSDPVAKVQLELGLEKDSKDMKIFFIVPGISSKGRVTMCATANLQRDV